MRTCWVRPVASAFAASAPFSERKFSDTGCGAISSAPVRASRTETSRCSTHPGGRPQGDRAVYAVRGAVCLLHLLWIWRVVPEALQPARRKPLDGKYRQPFTFFDLFRTTPILTKMTCFNVLEIFTEGKNF